MKIAYCSDLHLEFGDIDLKNDGNADLLILSGDIFVAIDFINKPERAERYRAFLARINAEFPKTFLILGNHEYYNGFFTEVPGIIRNEVNPYANIHFLDGESAEFGGYLFVGNTLWTDMNRGDPRTLAAMKNLMNDFRIIYMSRGHGSYYVPTTFRSPDAVSEHNKSLDIIHKALKANDAVKPVVIIGHHAPSYKSIHPMFYDDPIMNGGYFSHLDYIMEKHPEIVLWTHGHMHLPFDYMINKTNVVCNPRGYYQREKRASEFKLEYVEV